MNAPDPINFGVCGMAAGLGLTEDAFREAYQRKLVPAPDTVRLKEPRWSLKVFSELVRVQIPVTAHSLQPVLQAMEALLRAERAEGWHDGKEGK